MKARTVIIGGGVMGAAIAWHVARRRDPLHEPVVLLEKTGLAAGSSGRSGAILRHFYSDAELVRMVRDSLRVYAGFQATTGRSIAFQRMGVLTIAGPHDAELLALVRRNADLALSQGVDARIVDAAAMRALVPGIEVADGSLGCHEPEGGGVEPVRTVEAIAALAREAGAITRLGARALDIVIESGRVTGVRTSDGSITAGQVVVAAGPWSGPLLQRAGAELPLTVVRPAQQFVALPRRAARAVGGREDALVDSVLDRFGVAPERLPDPVHPVVLDLERGFYTRNESHAARTRIGRLDHSEDPSVADPDEVDAHVAPEFTRWARTAIEGRLPAYAKVEDAGTTVGLYTLTPDSQAAIGPWPGIEGLFVVTGFSGHGFKLAPSVGEGVARMLDGAPAATFDERFFAPARFTSDAAHAPGRGFGL